VKNESNVRGKRPCNRERGRRRDVICLGFHVSRARHSGKISMKMKKLDCYQIVTSNRDCRAFKFLFNVNCII
jgi:hypothetical protein